MKTLEAEAGAFAADLTDTLNSVFDLKGEEARFLAFQAPSPRGPLTRLSVHSEPRAIRLHIASRPALELVASFRCRWDRHECYLAVDRSSWSLLAVGFGDPLFRHEFVSSMQDAGVPCFHLHVHAHRDEVLYQLVRAERGKPRSRSKIVTGESEGALPRLADLHFPLGGTRLRPCLEDLCTFLISEFAVETVAGYADVLSRKRVDWRRLRLPPAWAMHPKRLRERCEISAMRSQHQRAEWSPNDWSGSDNIEC